MNARTRSAAYWTCQIAGWGGYSAVGLWFAASQVARLQESVEGTWPTALVVGYLLYPVYSIALTDLLRREGLRRRWFSGEGRHGWLSLVGAVLAIGAVQTFLIVATNVTMEGAESPFRHVSQIAYVALGTTAATSLWVVYYLVLTERRRRREQEAVLQLALREAELRALEAQISPHFLFNCLNSIRGLVVEDPARAQEMITRLANLLRHNLRHDAGHTVPFSSELDAVSDYLALESARFDERLRVRLDIAPDALPVPVPSMLLQTLVENAVKHGIASRPEGGDLVIRAGVDAGRMVFEVENSGCLQRVDSATTRVGLANTRDRLRILYGARADLHLTEPGPDRVIARVAIPLAP